MKKILALILSVLMLVTACIGVATVSAADSAPVVLFDGDQLNAVVNNNCYCLQGTYSYGGGFIRYQWFNQGGSVDPWMWLVKENSSVKVAPYMAIKYRTQTAGLTGAAHIGNGSVGQSKVDWDYSVADGTWATAIVYLPDYLGQYYNESDNLITHLRFEVAETGYSDTLSEWVDVEYVAFFNSYTDATNFQHTMPVDPDTAAGGSYATFDFTTATNLSSMLGHEYQMSAALVDGALRITATGADPYAKLLINGSDQLGLAGKYARYILVKYKTSATNADGTPMQIKFFSNVDGVAGWGQPGSYTNGDNLTSDGQWHYVMVDASGAWGTQATATLNAFRIDALDACAAGDVIDIATIKFFTTSDWVQNYITGLVETDAAAKEMATVYGWVAAPDTETDTETETEPVDPPVVDVMLGDVTGDGVVSTKDLTRMKKYLAADGDGSVTFDVPEAGDVTGDGVVSTKDLTRLKKYLASDGDGSVTLG